MSIVIITRNRREALTHTLETLTAQPHALPIIVVDNASSDGTAERVRKRFPAVRVIALPQNMGAAARNVGVEAAGTPYVAFCDDDSWWQPEAFERAIAYFERYPEVGLIAGKILVNDEQKLDPVSALQAASPLPRSVPMPGPAILGFLGCGVFVRTRAFLEVGGYDEKLQVGGEEQVLAIDLASAGWGLTYAGDLVGHHHPSPQRHPERRIASQTRNHIWTTWLRRPWRPALRITLEEARAATGNIHRARGVTKALLGMPHIVRHRRVPPPDIERQLRMLEAQEAPSAAMRAEPGAVS
jgi:GT2 family glycosyltransferase